MIPDLNRLLPPGLVHCTGRLRPLVHISLSPGILVTRSIFILIVLGISRLSLKFVVFNSVAFIIFAFLSGMFVPVSRVDSFVATRMVVPAEIIMLVPVSRVEFVEAAGRVVVPSSMKLSSSCPTFGVVILILNWIASKD